MIYTNELFQIIFANNGVYFDHCGVTFLETPKNKTMAQNLGNLFQLQLLDLFSQNTVYTFCVCKMGYINMLEFS